MSRIPLCRCLAVLGLLTPVALAQPPAPPALPPIAPNLARLEYTLTGLHGPGVAIASREPTGILAAANEQGTIQCWPKDVSMGVRVGADSVQELKGHQGPVTALAWRGGPLLASAGVDQKVLLWEMPDGKLLNTLPAGTVVRALDLSPDATLLASAGDDAAVQLWDIATAKPTVKLAGHTDWVLALAFSGDGKLLASGGYDGVVRLWEVPSGKKLLDIPATPPPPANTPAGPTNIVLALAFSPDGKTLALGGSDSLIHLVNVADGKLVRSMPGHTSSVTSLVFHPSGMVLISGSKDRTVKLWNPAAGQMLKSLEGHTAWVQGVTLLAQGTRLASVGADQTVRLWDLTDPAAKK
jgi:WD40 repeat protein